MSASRLVSALAVTAVLISAVAAQDDAGRSALFVAEFEQACVPGRLTYGQSLAAAAAAGWAEVAPKAHAELAALMEVSLAEAESMASDPDFSDARFDYTAFEKSVGAQALHLVISRSSVVIGSPDDARDPWVFVDCHLYDFEAVAPPDPAPVSALTGNPISRTQEQDGVVMHVWGPPCPMPRTGDTYLTFVGADAQIEQLPFTGIALNFSTSELPEGEPVPDPYC